MGTTERLHSKQYWRGYVDGAEDARNRFRTSTGPNAPFGNVSYDSGYSHGWTAERLRLLAAAESATCGVHFRDGSTCIRPAGHPTQSEDAIGHSASPVSHDVEHDPDELRLAMRAAGWQRLQQS